MPTSCAMYVGGGSLRVRTTLLVGALLYLCVVVVQLGLVAIGVEVLGPDRNRVPGDGIVEGDLLVLSLLVRCHVVERNRKRTFQWRRVLVRCKDVALAAIARHELQRLFSRKGVIFIGGEMDGAILLGHSP